MSYTLNTLMDDWCDALWAEMLAWMDGRQIAAPIPEVDRSLIAWFPVEDLPTYVNKDGKRVVSQLPAPNDHYVCEHRGGWHKVAARDMEFAVEWVAQHSRGRVVQFANWHLFFEDRADAQAFQKAVSA